MSSSLHIPFRPGSLEEEVLSFEASSAMKRINPHAPLSKIDATFLPCREGTGIDSFLFKCNVLNNGDMSFEGLVTSNSGEYSFCYDDPKIEALETDNLGLNSRGWRHEDLKGYSYKLTRELEVGAHFMLTSAVAIAAARISLDFILVSRYWIGTDAEGLNRNNGSISSKDFETHVSSLVEDADGFHDSLLKYTDHCFYRLR